MKLAIVVNKSCSSNENSNTLNICLYACRREKLYQQRSVKKKKKNLISDHAWLIQLVGELLTNERLYQRAVERETNQS